MKVGCCGLAVVLAARLEEEHPLHLLLNKLLLLVQEDLETPGVGHLGWQGLGQGPGQGRGAGGQAAGEEVRMEDKGCRRRLDRN